MNSDNFKKMMEVIDEVFATRQHPDQLQINAKQQKKLKKIHPATMLEMANENGPLIWIILIPTTLKIMEQFLSNQISEKKLLELTPLNSEYDCIYLCSASTLPEMRNKGATRQLCMDGIEKIKKDHPIKTLFVWPFSEGGQHLADTIAKLSGLSLKIKK